MFSNRFSLPIVVVVACTAELLSSCEKDAPVYSDIPAISLISVSPSSVTETQAITFSIKYTDGDGDLGENNPAIYNLFLTDTRVNVTYQYRIDQLAPDNSNIAITGTLDVMLNSTAITDGSSSQNIIYTIYVIDRAGHQSNTITCPVLNVHK